MITPKQRKKIPKSEMGLPQNATKGGGAVSGTYPVDTLKRAYNAKARAAEQLSKGNLTHAQYAEVTRKANNRISKVKQHGK